MIATLRAAFVFLVVFAAGALLGSAITQWDSREASADSVEVQRQMGERIRVEVLNAGGRRDMARRATDVLRSAGFDVVYYGNAESFGQEVSRVLDRVGRLDNARAVAGALGIADVTTEVDRNLYLDVTVRLGSDWSPAAAPQNSQRDSVGSWWDPRNLLEGLREP